METKKYLNLTFKREDDSSKTYRIPNLKDDVKDEEIKACGDTMLDKNIFEMDLTNFEKAKVISTKSREIDLKSIPDNPEA